MKKIIKFLLIVFITFLSSCKGEVIVTEMIANYDYGNISLNKATMLFNGCEKFFDENDYDIDLLLAGDILKISHTGSMQIALSYPGKVHLSGGKIKNIEVIESFKFSFTIYQVPGENENYRQVVSDDTSLNFLDIPSYVITSLEGSYINISNVSHGSRVIGTVSINDKINENTFKVTALYLENIMKAQ
jgi:hypothetical protein